MNALTPLEQRRALEARTIELEARIVALEDCLRRHGILMPENLSADEPGWVGTFLGDEGTSIVRNAVLDAATDHGIEPEAILRYGRRRELTRARQDAMFRAHKGGASYSQIARAMRRDHTTVMHGVRAEKKRREKEARHG